MNTNLSKFLIGTFAKVIINRIEHNIQNNIQFQKEKQEEQERLKRKQNSIDVEYKIIE